MTLDQMASLRRWHLMHRNVHRVEHRIWDLLTTLWMAGWAGLPVTMLLAEELTPWLCVGLTVVPSAYVALRIRLHRRGRLRCDWLAALGRSR